MSQYRSYDFAQYRHHNNPSIPSHHLAPPDITIPVDNDQYRPSHDFAQYRHHNNPSISSHHLAPDNGPDITIPVDNEYRPSHHLARVDDDRYRPGQDSNVVHSYESFHVRDTLIVNMDPVGSLAPPSGKTVHRTIEELLRCSKYTPLDLEHISGFIFEDDNPDVQLAVLELLEDAAELEKENFITFMPVTFDRVTHLLSSPDFRVHWGALDVLTCFFSSGYHDEAVKSVVPPILRHLQSPEPDVQLACMGLLDVAARSNSIELVAIVAPMLPTLDAALCVLKVSAESSKDKLAEAVADILPNLAPLLSAKPDAHSVAKALLDASALSNNRKLVAAAATVFSDAQLRSSTRKLSGGDVDEGDIWEAD